MALTRLSRKGVIRQLARGLSQVLAINVARLTRIARQWLQDFNIVFVWPLFKKSALDYDPLDQRIRDWFRKAGPATPIVD
jgi:hypothetical protein